jgi:Protein of unknown function (DUF2934)
MDRNSEIAKIAYELYIRRQGAPGDPQSDWLVAERIFAEREGLENQETPTTQNLETAASAGTVKRPRVRAKSNGSSKSEIASNERSSVKSKIDKIVTETTPRKKRTTNK